MPKKFVKEAKQIIGKESDFIPISTNFELGEDIDESNRPIVIHKASKPYKEIGSDEELEDIREVLSCTT